ncbi:hypothetical protein CALCODRAFT_478720 [Calocera cornea HHB12733]|uniref:Long chronological lifespan protein 2 n=1 Tax=Calocera cornea HHB12733 TaxID=1353952 RepID=A0A165K859_9BASI|nr:hypothetical protein CALCODRAFT_478720 [Calocera cornea HHB12733]
MLPRTLPLPLNLLLPLLLLPLATAQFNIFDQFFGSHTQQQQRQQGHPSQQHAGGGQQSLWQAQADAVPCAAYLCPTTLHCVPAPADCPCPSVQDIKCLVPDAQTGAHTVVCARAGGAGGCADVDRLARAV